MKNFFVLLGVLAIVSVGVLSYSQVNYHELVFSKAHAQCDTQDPNSSCFAPGETSDPVPEATCDTQDPYSSCFAPGEKADDPTPQNYSTPSYTSTPKSTTATPVSQPSYPSADDIRALTQPDDSGGVGILGALFLSPIVSMIVSIIGFFLFIGIIILVVVLVLRRSNKKEVKSDQPVKSEKADEPKEKK